MAAGVEQGMASSSGELDLRSIVLLQTASRLTKPGGCQGRKADFLAVWTSKYSQTWTRPCASFSFCTLPGIFPLARFVLPGCFTLYLLQLRSDCD